MVIIFNKAWPRITTAIEVAGYEKLVLSVVANLVNCVVATPY